MLACLLSTGTHRTIDNNHIDGALYWNSALTYRFRVSDAATGEDFLNVRNLANAAPPVVAPLGTGSSYWSPLSNAALYDFLGRIFRAGVRFTM